MYNSGTEQKTAKEFLCVSHDASRSQWEYFDQDANTWVAFIPQQNDDVLIAELDFDFNAVLGMLNFDGNLDGLPYGYSSNDLIFNATADGSGNVPLLNWGVDGTFFCTLSSSTLNRRLLQESFRENLFEDRLLEGVEDQSIIGIKIEVGLCNSHEFEWLGNCYSCELTSCDSGYYLSSCDGLSTYDSSECSLCTTSSSCASTQFLFGTCTGNTTIDVQQCKECSECVSGMVDSTGQPCEKNCDSDPIFSNCPSEVRIVSDPDESWPHSSGVGTGFWSTIVANDVEDGTLTALPYTSINGGLDSGSTFSVGTTPLKFFVNDSIGTIANCSFDVVVVNTSTRCNFGSYWSPQIQSCVLCAQPGSCGVGEYYDAETRCRGYGMSDDSCRPCTTLGNCPVDHYFVGECDGTSTFDSSCSPCTSAGSCDDGEYYNDSTALCTGAGIEDKRCVACTPVGGCAIGEYWSSSGCDGTGNQDETCVPCTGSCPNGHFYDVSICDGFGTSDGCQPCTAWNEASGNWSLGANRCNPGFFLNTSACPGTETSNNACLPCTANGSCPIGFYFDSKKCSGSTEEDNSCQPCTGTGNCPFGFYNDATSCDGTTDSDTSCTQCTIAGQCLAGFFHNRSACAGDTTSDSSCQVCATSCSPGNYYIGAAESCDGSTRYDDSCTHCVRKGQCPPGKYFNESTCIGNDATTDACFDCKQEGECSVGYYYDASRCDGRGADPDAVCVACSTSCEAGYYLDSSVGCQGDGVSDDVCIACSMFGACEQGFYYNASNCDAGTATQDSCVQCASSQAECATGTYFDSAGCTGKGRSDNACKSCCNGGKYHDGGSTCDGSTGCLTCTFTASSTCGDNFYHNLDGCDGTGVVDDECIECRASPDDCVSGTFLSPACTGTETSDVANCTLCDACKCGTGGMYYYNSAFCSGNNSGCLRARGCNNNCNGHGICDMSIGLCTCFVGWGAPDDIALYKAPDCSQRTCPHDFAWFDVPTSNVTAHTTALECSGRGICDRSTGECQCSPPFSGEACQVTTCMAAFAASHNKAQSMNFGRTISCSGHGRCVDMTDMASEETALPLNNEVSLMYDSQFDSGRIFGCVCDSSWAVGLEAGDVQESEWFGPDCSLRHCPTGDNPKTIVDETNCTGINGGVAGNLCLVECASQGDCNHQTGECACREGFGGENCATIVIVTETGSSGWGGIIPGHDAGGGRVREFT